MLLSELAEAIQFLRAHRIEGVVHAGYVPASYPNMTPAHPSDTYIVIELNEDDYPVPDVTHKGLRKLGRVPEDEGRMWYNHTGPP